MTFIHWTDQVIIASGDHRILQAKDSGSVLALSRMSSTDYPSLDDDQASFNTPTFSSRIIVSAGVILVMVILLLALFLMHARWQWMNPSGRWRAEFGNHEEALATPAGLDPSVVASLPTFAYRKENQKGGAAMECCVCVSEFEENEMGRSLPKCKHSFHTACIDMWFCTHSTCPLCRASVLVDDHPHMMISQESSDDENLPGVEDLGNWASEQESRLQDISSSSTIEDLSKIGESSPQLCLHSHPKLERNFDNAQQSSEKVADHLVLQVFHPMASDSDHSAARTTPATPTTTPTSPLKYITRILSMRENRVVPITAFEHP